MSRRFLQLCVCLVVTSAAAAAPVGAAPQAKIPKAILEKRLEAARSVFQQHRTRIQDRAALPAELYGWSERWLEAELALCDTAAGRATALRAHLDRTRAVERLVAAAVRAGQGRQVDADAATYFRLEAEIRLLKEGLDPSGKDKEGK